MDRSKLIEPVVLAIALVVLVLDASGGPGWSSSAHATLAARLDHLASSPLYDVLAGAASLVPAGEPGFRLGLLAALLGALTITGVVAAVRALVPREPASAIVAALLVLAAPPFREAAAFATPALLAACGAVWAFAWTARYARAPDSRAAISALACCVLVVGSTPWFGAVATAVIIVWLVRAGMKRELVALSVGALGVIVIALWFGALGTLPSLHGGLAAVAASGRGAAAIVIGAGLLGVGFGAATGLPHARWLAALVLLAGVHEALFGPAPSVLLALLAIGVAIVPSALVRATVTEASGARRHAVTFAAGAPLLIAALATGPAITVDDPRATPADLAADLTATLPPGPGYFVATRTTSWLVLQHEFTLAGARPDLTLVPPLPGERADAIVANALREGKLAGADAAAFGRLDIRRAIARGRGFQLTGEVGEPQPVLPPARYATRIGVEQAALLALERARHEAASGRLDRAARAVGLEARFGAADLALLATTMPSRERPALFGFLPLDDERPGPWLYDIFGDDLAWVAGLVVPPVDVAAPMPRRLHAKWREILVGKAKPDDPAIIAMGPRAVAATRALFSD